MGERTETAFPTKSKSHGALNTLHPPGCSQPDPEPKVQGPLRLGRCASCLSAGALGWGQGSYGQQGFRSPRGDVCSGQSPRPGSAAVPGAGSNLGLEQPPPSKFPSGALRTPPSHLPFPSLQTGWGLVSLELGDKGRPGRCSCFSRTATRHAEWCLPPPLREAGVGPTDTPASAAVWSARRWAAALAWLCHCVPLGISSSVK